MAETPIVVFAITPADPVAARRNTVGKNAYRWKPVTWLVITDTTLV
jgi:hypothetical protein